MALDLFKLLGTIEIDNKGANAALDETSNKGQQTQSKLSSAFSKAGTFAAKAGKVVATGLAAGGAAMAGLSIKAMNLGGELEQNMGGSEAVFKEYAGKMQDTAKNAFSNMGLSTSDFLATANKMGALFQGAGFSIEESSNLSASAMQRAADVASIMGIDTSAAMEAIAGAAKGNFTMMDNLGVAMNDTTLNAYALEKGLGKTTQEMTNQEKIALAMELFMEKTAYAAGNYAKENETLAGSLSTAKSALTNFLDGSGDVESLVSSFGNLANVAVKSLQEILPRLTTGLTDIVNQIMPMLPPLLEQLLPSIIEGATSLINGLVNALPGIISALTGALPALMEGIFQIMDAIVQNLPVILDRILSELPTLVPLLVTGVVQMLLMFCEALPNIIEVLTTYLPWILETIVSNLMENLPILIEGLTTLIVSLVEYMPIIIMALIESLPTILTSIVQGLIAAAPILIDGVKNIWNTMVEAVKGLLNSLIEFVSGIWQSIYNSSGEKMRSIMDTIIVIWNAIKNNVTTAVNAIKNVITTVWNAIKNVISTVINAVKNVISTAWNAIKTIIANVMNIIFSIIEGDWSSVKASIGNILNAIKSVISSVWNGIKSVISSVLSGIKSVISSVFNGIKSTITSIWNGIKSVTSSVWNNIKSAMTEPIEAAKEKISGIIEKIKGFFTGMKLEFPNIKLPHFSISPSGWKIGDLLKGSIPKLGIDWYAKAMDSAMLLEKPTIFGYDQRSGNLMGGGEAGAEVVSGANTLMSMIRNAVALQNGELTAVLYKILNAILMLDDNMGGHMRDALDGMSWDINKREFARLVKAVD